VGAKCEESQDPLRPVGQADVPAADLERECAEQPDLESGRGSARDGGTAGGAHDACSGEASRNGAPSRRFGLK
jgi:hypothetical protein